MRRRLKLFLLALVIRHDLSTTFHPVILVPRLYRNEVYTLDEILMIRDIIPNQHSLGIGVRILFSRVPGHFLSLYVDGNLTDTSTAVNQFDRQITFIVNLTDANLRRQCNG